MTINRRNKRILILIGMFSFVVFVITSGFFYYQLTRPFLKKAVIFEVKAGDSQAHVLQHLVDQGLISYPFLFSIYIRLHNEPLKTGEYWLPPYSSSQSIWQQVSRGKGFYNRFFTIVPGWTIKQLREALKATPTLHHQAIYQNDQVWAQKLGMTTIPEGLFLPETFFYTKGTLDWSILKSAKRLMDQKLAILWTKRDADLPFNRPYDALIAASLVEKEVYRNDERPIIAGVLVNRLNKKMLLQCDPTVIYSLGERYDGSLHKRDLEEKTPYNTYIYKGLPPTPIALPSLQSIQAVLHPTQHPYFYFVLKGGGWHQFSATLDAHHEAVAIYRKQS